MIKYFKLTGLSKEKSSTLETENGQHIFNSPLSMDQDRFDALFNYFKNHPGSWTGDERALVRFDCLSDEGIPVNPNVLEITLP